MPPGWQASEKGDLKILTPTEKDLPNAYDVVVEEVLEGDRSMFLGTEVGGCCSARTLVDL